MDARDTFLFQNDRELIAGFLAGCHGAKVTFGGLARKDNALMFGASTVAWLNPVDGALMGKLLEGSDYHLGARVIHALCQAL